MESKFQPYVETISLILLLPALLIPFSNLISIIGLWSVTAGADPAEQSYILNTSVEAIINDQIYSLAALIPGLVVASLIIQKNSHFSGWYQRAIKVASILMLLALPVVSIAGVYLFLMSRKFLKEA